jgi:predicted glycoside hydrolase/deacetylase ChbG (UPF0249 family)
MQPAVGDGRYLIVNADDFGQTPAINRGVVTAFEGGIVTSASLMVRWQASAEAAEYVRLHPKLSLGLHLDLGEWAYRDDEWIPIYEVAPTSDAAACELEIARQLATFRDLTGREPTHLDSHQHLHAHEPVLAIVRSVAGTLHVPLRNFDAQVHYDGSFYGQSGRGYPVPEAITVDRLVRMIASLPAGVTELGCHPGQGDDTHDTMYRAERPREVRALCDPRVRAQIAASGVRLCSFADYPISGLARSSLDA